MKRLFAMTSALVALIVAAPLFAHHMAEGIVDDDTYAMIDERLLEADSPHLSLDLSTIMDDANETATAMVVTITVEEAQLDEVLEIVADVLAEVLPGTGAQMQSSVDVLIEPSDGIYTITITESIGAGEAPQEQALEEPLA
jgi:hypothetical protein